jgi:adenylylsulfate kinase
MNNVIWLTGNSQSGKSTLAKAVKANMPCVVLDGDEMRDTISLGLGFSKVDRTENNRRIASLAALLAGQGHMVVVSVVAPFADLRAMVDGLCRPYWVHVRRTVSLDYESPYEDPESPQLTIDNDRLTPAEASRKLLEFIRDTKFEEPWTHGVSSLNHNNA